MNLSLANSIQEVLHVVRFAISQLWVQYQPSFEVLFRTEEVVDSSTASQEDSSCGRLEPLDSPILKDQMNALTAIL